MLVQPEQPQDQAMPEPQPIEPPQSELQPKPANKRKQFFIIGGAALLIIVLAGAAFLAGTLMNKKNTNNQNGLGSGGPVLTNSKGGVAVSKKISSGDIKPAKELPTVQADVRGLFISRTGNSITIGTGQVTIGISKNSDSGAVTPQASYNGPINEVVLTKDTLVYKDTTPIDFSASSNAPIQQTVATGSLDDLNGTTMISVWGKKTGDRYVADVLLYMSPLVKMSGGAGGATK